MLTPNAIHPAERSRERFGEFWEIYPRRVERQRAVTAWAEAVTRATVEEILAGARARARWWSRARTPMDKIPYPWRWLHGDRWADEIEPLPKVAAASQAQAQADIRTRRRDEAEAALDDGNAELAWDIVCEQAGYGDERQRLFAKIASELDRHTDDFIVLVTHCPIEEVQRVRAVREQLRARAQQAAPSARASLDRADPWITR